MLEASIRDAIGGIDHSVDLRELTDYFSKMNVPPNKVDLMVEQVVNGQSLKFRERRVRLRGKMLPSCKGFERSIAAQNWVDAGRRQTIIGGPETLPAMAEGESMCHPNGRVEKRNTATGEPTGKGRLIAQLSFQHVKCDALMFMSRIQSIERPFGTYNLAHHRDIARLWCQIRSQPFGKFIGAKKNDGDCYFRRWYVHGSDEFRRHCIRILRASALGHQRRLLTSAGRNRWRRR